MSKEEFLEEAFRKERVKVEKKMSYAETKLLTKCVDDSDGYYTIGFDDNMFTSLSKEHGVKPKPGDKMTIYSKGGMFGTIRGMDVNGEEIFFKTDRELEEERQQWLKNNQERKEREFAENVAKMDAQYDALPKPFQERIDRFRANNDQFRVEYEPYELFCCEEAVKIAEACKTAEEVKRVSQLDYTATNEAIPNLSDGHSGNTIGCAFRLAFWYLENAENVVKMHGALSPLVGSKAYGDMPEQEGENADEQ